MKSRSGIAALVVASLALFIAMIGPANAGHLITGKDIKNDTITGKKLKNDTITGKQVKESTLKAVPEADSLGVEPSGKTESGGFAGAGGDSTSGYFGVGVTYPVPIRTAVANDHIIDTRVNPDPTVCPGVGKAAKGYLCLYISEEDSVGTGYGWSAETNYSLHPSYGAGLYFPITGTGSYVDGSWTVGAP